MGTHVGTCGGGVPPRGLDGSRGQRTLFKKARSTYTLRLNKSDPEDLPVAAPLRRETTATTKCVTWRLTLRTWKSAPGAAAS